MGGWGLIDWGGGRKGVFGGRDESGGGGEISMFGLGFEELGQGRKVVKSGAERKEMKMIV